MLVEGSVESVTPTVENCSARPVGNPLPEACYPLVSISTRLGTVLANVPVDWDIPSGSPGAIAARSGPLGSLVCGPFGTAAATTTSAAGNAGVCWTLGGVGLNRVIATPRAGGDAPDGVVFESDGFSSVTFDVDVTAASLEIFAGDGQVAPPGSVTPIYPKVRVVSPSGAPLAGVVVDWSVELGAAPSGVSPVSVVSDAGGYARAAWTLGEGENRLRAEIRSSGGVRVSFVATGASTPGTPASISVVEGDGVVAGAGQLVSPAPRVILTDANGVPLPGVTIKWLVLGGGGSTAMTTSVTGSDGTAANDWTYGTEGNQKLIAYYDVGGLYMYVYLKGTAVAP
jgi:hypothetical protein